MVWEEKLKFFLLLLGTKCHKVGLAIITVGPSDIDEQLVQLFLGPNARVLGWTNSWSTLGYICHKDERFLRTSVHGPKRAGLNVARTKGRGTKHQGALE
jgi:hypothetical protein